MAVNIDVTEEKNIIDIQDVDSYSIDITDLSPIGSISVKDDSSSVTEDVISQSTVIRTITLPTEELTIVEVVSIDSNILTVETTTTDIIEVTDNIAIVQVASSAATRAARELEQIDQLWTLEEFNNQINYTDGNVGIGLTNPNFDLQVVGDLFAPVISASRMQIHGLPDNGDVEGLFIVQINRNDEMQSKFVVDLNGVTILGAFNETPPAKTGGMFFSSSGNFYLGF